VKLFEAVDPPSKRMERLTTPSIADQTSLHKISLSSKGKVLNRSKPKVPQSPINFTAHTYGKAV